MKEKIEAILRKYTSSYSTHATQKEALQEKGNAGFVIHLYNSDNFSDSTSDITKDLTTLINQEKKEAVEGFVKWQFNEDNPIKMQRWNIIGFSLEDMLDEVKEYQKSEGK